MNRHWCFAILLFMLSVPCYCQEQVGPFETEILAFDSLDALTGSQDDFILFIGSSSIRLWQTLENDFSEYKVMNRGFGGAKLIDLNHYWERILKNHKPKLVVLYCGENDIWDGYSVKETFNQFKVFQKNYREDLKKVPLIYIAMKPSPSRWNKWPDFKAADKKIKRRIKLAGKQKFIDLSPSMLLKDGLPKPGIFLSDELHMNELGYEGWVSLLKPFVEKNLRPD